MCLQAPIILRGTLELPNRKVTRLVPGLANTEYCLLEHLEILEWQKTNTLSDVKAGCGEFPDGLRVGKLGGTIDIYHAAAQPESAAQLWIKLGPVVDAVEHVVKHDDIDRVIGCIGEIHQAAHAVRDQRREERLRLEHRNRVGSLELERANELIGFPRVILRVLRARQDANPGAK